MAEAPTVTFSQDFKHKDRASINATSMPHLEGPIVRFRVSIPSEVSEDQHRERQTTASDRERTHTEFGHLTATRSSIDEGRINDQANVRESRN